MSIPNPLDEASTRQAVEYFRQKGFDQVDTAIMYQGGKSEVTLGESVRLTVLYVPLDAHDSIPRLRQLTVPRVCEKAGGF